MNAYKEAWASQCNMLITKRRIFTPANTRGKNTRQTQAIRSRLLEEVVAQKGQKITLGAIKTTSEMMSRSALKGRVGVAIRLTGRIGVRAVPVVGAAMLAYDIYRAYNYLTD